jgi:hypothetical protein
MFGKTALLVMILATGAEGDAKQDALAAWRKNVQIARVSDREEHSIHAYYVTTPESPDGKSVLYFASTNKTGEEGEIRVVDRGTKQVAVVAQDVVTEDAHRAACQQWVSAGKRIAFHNVLDNGRWVVTCVDRDGTNGRVLATGRQKGFSAAAGNVVPLYGPHWAPGEHRDLDLVDVESGEIRSTSLTAKRVVEKYPAWIARQFGERPISIFFPVLSPDESQVFVKLATPRGGDFRSREASDRYGLIGYDLNESSFRFMQEDWGHPAWSADSKSVINVGGRITDAATGKVHRVPNHPTLRGSHPALSPDGKLFTSDALGESFGGAKGSWIVGVGSVETGEFVMLHRFENSRGARSWRVSHPHPVFSPDGRRVYYNVSEDEWTRLYVAQAGE